jgi:hypothetical protein
LLSICRSSANFSARRIDTNHFNRPRSEGRIA